MAVNCVISYIIFFCLFLLVRIDVAVAEESCSADTCKSPLEDSPTLSELQLLRNNGSDDLRIMKSIPADKMAELAIAMFNDTKHYDDIEFKCNKDPPCMKTDLFKVWLEINDLATWKMLIQIFRRIELNLLAKKIESIIVNRRSFSQNDNHWIKSGLNLSSKKSEYCNSDQEKVMEELMLNRFQNHHKYKETLEIITSVKYCIAEVIINRLKEEHSYNSHYSQLQDISSDIDVILDRVHNSTIYTGVIGMTKAGKSTVLNSLLGKSYLPSSIQPQTAKEVSIIHDLDNSDGVLYGIDEKERHELARGKKDIAQIILSLNSAERYSRSSYDKLVLHAPLVFLEGIRNVRLELSDTPGLNKAGFTIKPSEAAVREKVTYIIILHVNTMKNIEESKLLKNLQHHHPKLLSKHRVLIIVNAYDLTFMDDSSESLKSKDISKYVSDYLNDSKITISPEYIIPFSGKWALKAQEWRDNPDLLLKAPKGETSYDAAVNILDFADYDIRELKNGFNLENVNKLCKLLLDFSNITIIKEKLLKMLHENSEEVLLGSALDDISSKIRDITILFSKLVIDEHLQEKETQRDSCKQSLGSFTDVINKHWSNLNELNLPKSLKDELDTSINSLVHSLKNNIDSNIKEKLNYLHNTREHLNRKHVETQIIQTKQQIPELVVDTINKEWANIVSAIKNGASSLLASDLNSFIYDLCSILDDSGFFDETEPLVSVIKNIHEVRTSLIPRITTPSFDINYHKSGVSDENVKRMILIGKTQKISKEEKKICGGRRYIIMGPKDCKHYTESTPYDVKNYSADIHNLQAVFTGVAKNWVKIVTERIDEVILEVSKGISANLDQELKSTISLVKEAFKSLLESCEKLVNKSEANIDLLHSKISELELLKKRLQSILIF